MHCAQKGVFWYVRQSRHLLVQTGSLQASSTQCGAVNRMVQTSSTGSRRSERESRPDNIAAVEKKARVGSVMEEADEAGNEGI